MRRLLVALLVLLGLLVVADRVAAHVAAGQLADQVSGELGARPAVQVGGFPFLTQVVRGRYTDLRLTAPRVDRSGVTVSHVNARLTGVDVPLSDALHRDVTAVPVQRLSVSGLVDYGQLERLAHRDLTFGPAPGGAVRVSGRLTVLGQRFDASAVSSVRLADGVLSLSAGDVQVGGVRAPAVLERALASQLDLRIPLPTLPYDVSLAQLVAGPDGVTVSGAAHDLVLRH